MLAIPKEESRQMRAMQSKRVVRLDWKIGNESGLARQLIERKYNNVF